MYTVATRYIAVFLGLNDGYQGDVLGEEQWQWLENQLKQEKEKEERHRAQQRKPQLHGDVNGEETYIPTSATVLCSGMQVLTLNPFVESWGHWPASKDRLMGLLHEYQPPGTGGCLLLGARVVSLYCMYLVIIVYRFYHGLDHSSNVLIRVDVLLTSAAAMIVVTVVAVALVSIVINGSITILHTRSCDAEWRCALFGDDVFQRWYWGLAS